MSTDHAESRIVGVANLAPAGPTAVMATQPSPQQQLHNKQVQDSRRKFNSHLEDHVLDYFHNNPANIEACLNTCIKLFGNVVHNPSEEKYRKVRTTNSMLKTTVLVVRGGEDILLHAGWVPRVIEMEKYWLFDAAEGSVRFDVLKESLHLCERALATVHEKAEKRRKEREEKLAHESAEKERIRIAIEEDRAEHKLRNELMAVSQPVAASPVGPQAAASTPPARRSPVRRSPGPEAGHKLGGST